MQVADEKKIAEEIEQSEVEQNENVEAVFDEESAADPSSDNNNVNDEAALLQDKIQELEEKLAESENRYLRLRADFDNFRRRVQLDRESSEKYRAQNIITNLLPAIDNFERAMQMTPDNEQAAQLMQGMEMVYRSILEALKQEGAVPIESVGKEFDPQYHQAIMQAEDENYGSNIVVEEFQKGYILNDRVIRPSMVKVNQ
ncbi:molecular chaperone GrpE [Heyndrickxia shackletonii]|uniref:Protein GrpE n=1 Tax=Heyndrickxia shackletonii TaxID=157838 RepID=A0A0Q3WWZ1_9BACI|nr:nucleotide exchange factor GrpE [Heyndrickxia shackletonii]KQL53495.1 molecular chaperone GrpE [Heyndrickxia shackletonii]MBB2480079.1 nucleotide exchange factor GrpE [Bacillus sp. APMAM]NEY99569.1 nucleotide exchange factor GrpE [Heyndrickxia shackletonii]RTZ56451.1 nucleotide exchange factor GrpE [Bacillus sp. SAJ1]